MLCIIEKSCHRVRFRTKKSVGFPLLVAIFDPAGANDSARGCGKFGGAFPRVVVGLTKC
jgi:hypothetical protein